VLGTMLLSSVLNFYHGALVGMERKAAGVPYPNAYAPHNEAATDIKKYRFNCAQRAHQNYLENLPTFLVTSAIAGIQYPIPTAVMGLVWCTGRFVYAKGYINSTMEQKGSGRYKGAWYLLAQLGLLGASAYTVYGLIMG
jgi:glutathione S-transferase